MIALLSNILLNVSDPFAPIATEIEAGSTGVKELIVKYVIGFIMGFAFLYGLYKVMYGEAKTGVMVLIIVMVIGGLLITLLG